MANTSHTHTQSECDILLYTRFFIARVIGGKKIALVRRVCVCITYTTTSGRSRANGICLSDVRKRYSLLMKLVHIIIIIVRSRASIHFRNRGSMRFVVRFRTSFEAVLRASQRRNIIPETH